MSLRETLENLCGTVQRRIVPGLLNSQYHYFRLLSSRLSERTRWLDVGSGHQIVPLWVKADQASVVEGLELAVGSDLDEASLKVHPAFRNRVICDLEQMPFRSSTFNLITANMVVEHLADPARVFGEVSRLLEPGGVLMIHTPNRNNYQSRIARLLPQWIKDGLMALLDGVLSSDVFPAFYRVNTEQSIRAQGNHTGLKVVRLEMVNTSTKLKVLLPLAIIELLWIRLLETEAMRSHRADIIAVLQKSADWQDPLAAQSNAGVSH